MLNEHFLGIIALAIDEQPSVLRVSELENEDRGQLDAPALNDGTVKPPIESEVSPNSPPEPDLKPHHRGIALALGGGAARGWAHIGVLRALDEAGVPISMIAGTSIGALVGGCYLAGKLDELEEFARSITRTNVLRYMDFTFRGSGLISGKKLAARMDSELGELSIEGLDRRFIAIATDIESGHEIWLEQGPLGKAIRASYALPGVFKPVVHHNRKMVDGALVNPVPVSACRAFDQRIVVAVNLSSETFGRSSVVRSTSFADIRIPSQPIADGMDAGGSWLPFGFGSTATPADTASRLGVTGVMIEAFNIIQDRITRSRLAGDPPDFTFRPKLPGIGLSDFHKADEAIEQGYQEGKLKLARLEDAGFMDAI